MPPDLLLGEPIDRGRVRHTVDADHAYFRRAPLERAETDLEQFVVPDWARYVAAFVDVQGGRNARFVVEVHAVGEHQREQLIDRYAITRSKREGVGEEFAPLDPASHAEDWDLLTERVVRASRADAADAHAESRPEPDAEGRLCPCRQPHPQVSHTGQGRAGRHPGWNAARCMKQA